MSTKTRNSHNQGSSRLTSSNTLRIAISIVYAYIIVAMSGWVDLANAVVSCTDVISPQTSYRYNEALYGFRYFNGKTYAIALSGITGKTTLPDGYFALSPGMTFEYMNYGTDSTSLKRLLATGKYGAARPVSITSQAVKDFIIQQYGPYLVSGPTLVDAWKEYGAAIPFTTISGGPLPLEPWETPPTPTAAPAAVSMNASGVWSPTTSGMFTRQIVELDGKLDCAIDPSAPAPEPPPPPTPDPDTLALMDLANYDGKICMTDSNADGELSSSEAVKCLATNRGDFCPMGALDCDTTFQPPVCPGGSTLNTSRDMCQADHLSVSCDPGFSWDSSIDKCVASPSCPDGGAFNGVEDRCEKLATSTCPAGYAVAGGGVCAKAVDCGTGIYNAATDRCESGFSSSGCPAGMAPNPAENRCEAAPSCAAGMTYNAARNICLQAVSTCTDGYSWNAARARCEKAPTCPAGTAYDAVSNNCRGAVICDPYDAISNSCTGSSTYTASEEVITCIESSYATCDVTTDPTCLDTFDAGVVQGSDLPMCDAVSCGPGESMPWTSLVGNTVYTGTARTCVGYLCSGGGTLSGTTCTTNGDPCPAGTSLDGAADQCVAVPSCTGGSGQLDGAVDTCYYAPAASCSAGQVYDVASGQCSLSATCVGGSLDASLDLCTLSVSCASMSCPSGFAWNETRGVCEKTPVCDAGLTYNATYNTCLQAVTSCSDGYTWNTTRQCCEMQPPECPGGTAYNFATNKCEGGPLCSSGTYDAAANACLEASSTTYAATYSCTGVWDVVVKDFGQYVMLGNTSPGALIGYLAPTVDGLSSWRQVGDGSVPGVPKGYCDTNPNTIPAATRGVIYLQAGYPTYGGSVMTVNIYTDDVPCYFSKVSSSGTCAYSCPAGGILSGATCTKSTTTTTPASCTGGTILDPVLDICIANPTCSSGGLLDGALDICHYNPAATCSAGQVYDAAAGQCAKPPTCSDGSVLNPATDQCTVAGTCTPLTDACPAGYSLDNNLGLCTKAGVCSPGVYDALEGRCEATIVPDCGTYSFAAETQKCIHVAQCPGPVDAGSANYSSQLNVCVGTPVHTCQDGLTWSTVPTLKCEAAPICLGAIYYDSTTDQCLTSAGCPYGNQYTCMPNPNSGTFQCSPHECINPSEGEAVELEPFDESYYQNDGKRDEKGECLGQLYIFSGKPSRCRPPGWTVGYVNDCCADGDLMPEDKGSGVGTVSGAYDLYRGAARAYDAYQGFNAAKDALSSGLDASQAVYEAAYQGMEAGLTGAAQEAFVSGAEAAVSGVSQGSAMISTGIQAMGPAIGVYAAGAVVGALGGDQDAQLAAQMAMTMALMSGPQMVIGLVVLVVMRFIMGTGCDANDIMTANNVASRRCHYIGSYCEKKIMGMCAQKAKGHCCFNSILARIMHEQGRPQLLGFQPNGAWGQAKKPNCRGFTPEEFQAIDFSGIDMTEYYGEMMKGIEERVQGASQRVQDTIKDRFEQIQKPKDSLK